MPGLPVAWNHKGVDEAVSGGAPFKHETLQNVGVVADAWVSDDGAGRAILQLTGHALPRLVGGPAVPGVSLTHTVDASGRALPVELSLVSRPARPGAVVEADVTAPRVAAAYKERWRPARTPATAITMDTAPDTAPAADVSPVEAALNSIADEAHRAALTARLEEMAAAAVAAKKEAAQATKDLGTYKTMQEADVNATAESVAAFLSNALSPAQVDRWGLAGMRDLRSDQYPATLMRNLVCASHERINQLKAMSPAEPAAAAAPAAAAPVDRAPKRSRTAEPAGGAGAAAPAESSALRMALASTFDY